VKAPEPPKAQWRRVLIAAAVTLALAALVLMLAYRAMSDDAESDAASRGGWVTPAVATAPTPGDGGARPARAVPRGLRLSS
jgi:hypothetical protein